MVHIELRGFHLVSAILALVIVPIEKVFSIKFHFVNGHLCVSPQKKYSSALKSLSELFARKNR